MYRQHSGNKNKLNYKQSGLNLKKLIRNTLITSAVVEAAVLPFLGFSFINFLLVFLISLVPAILVFFMISGFTESTGNSSLKEQKHNTVNPELLIRSHSKNKSSKLVVLEHKNFNWNIEDIVKDPEVKEQNITKPVNKKEDDLSEIKKRYNPYRSPFEPINPVIDNNNNVDPEPDFFISSDNEISVPVEEYLEPQDNEEIYNDYTKNQFDIEEAIQNTAAATESKEELSMNLYQDIDQGALQDAGDFEEEDEINCDGEDDINSTNSVQDDRKVLKLVFKQKEIEIKPPVTKEPVFNKAAVKKEEFPYALPEINLLKKQVRGANEDDFNVDIENTANKLIETLASFGVGARVLDVSRGPSVTRYELQPNAGVKVSKIVGLADDIALNLAATGVRIEAPIPGKAAVGIEVPNKEVKAVLLRDVIETEEFLNHPSKLAFAVGKDVAGRIVVGDIAKMPHLLIAGATGSGKSVCINTLIASILYKASPKEVKLLMVDPKVVELGIYNGIPHLLIPVVTDPKKAAGALSWAVVEMTTRYKLFAENNTRDLKGYNALMKERGEELLPHIVIIIDELADLMMVAPNDVEDCICRLAQMARAAGMHLVIATQRPSVDVITGVIKANIPSRISFAVSSQIDSRTILDMAGAEKLLGRGDMLYYPIGEPKPVRLQGGFISDKEVEDIVSRIKSNFQAEYDQDVLDKINCQPEQQHDLNDEDELLPQAIEMAFANGQASASLMQRKFKVGYSRAARILDQMESWGVVGPAEGSKPRQLLITKQEWDELNS